MSAVVLAGCASAGAGLGAPSSGETDDPLAEPAEAYEMAAPAFHFESGTLELGDFDPATLGDDLFDPCTEISEAEFEAAGMTGVAPENVISNSSNGTTLGCDTDTIDHGIVRNIVSARTPAKDMEAIEGFEVNYENSEVPGAYLLTNPVVFPDLCAARVDTVRGSLGISMSVSSMKQDQTDICAIALENLERLFDAVQPVSAARV